MSIIRDDDTGERCLTCDTCGYCEECFDTFGEAIDFAKENGWRCYKNEMDDWEHICPDCIVRQDFE